MAGILLGPRVKIVAAGTVALADDERTTSHNSVWTLGADGYTYFGYAPGFVVQGPQWINPRTGMEQFEVMVSLAGDPLHVDSGTDAWLSCSSAPSWGYNMVGDAASGELSVSIRRLSDGVEVDTATILLDTTGTLVGGGGGGDEESSI